MMMNSLQEMYWVSNCCSYQKKNLSYLSVDLNDTRVLNGYAPGIQSQTNFKCIINSVAGTYTSQYWHT